jgi:hypothetical protein
LSGRGGEFLHDVAQPPVAPPRTSMRPDNDKIAVFFLGRA